MSAAGVRAPDGPGRLLLVDKPIGPTSHDVVALARRTLDTRRVGHTGTLDPFASGLLLLCVGVATRLVEYFHVLSKRYVATVRLGRETSTHDPRGRETAASGSWRAVDEADWEAALARQHGELKQRPPAHSAVRVEGRRAHRLARAGREICLEPRTVRVHELRTLSFRPPFVRFEACVSTGTYLRAIARDVGRDLGCGGYLARLRRTGLGPFGVQEALHPYELPAAGERRADGEGRGWRTPAGALAWLPRRELSEEEAEAVRHGRPVPRGDTTPGADGEGEQEEPAPVLLLREGALVAIAEARGTELQPRKVLTGA